VLPTSTHARASGRCTSSPCAPTGDPARRRRPLDRRRRPADARATLPEATIDPDDDATIFYTSGTTGFPKGAQLTHRGSVHNILNLVFMTTVHDASWPSQGDRGRRRRAARSPAAHRGTGPPVFMAPTRCST
jgi:acyl-CoA synthetase (AMP-forming)/AMP-acid ligase II